MMLEETRKPGRTRPLKVLQSAPAREERLTVPPAMRGNTGGDVLCSIEGTLTAASQPFARAGSASMGFPGRFVPGPASEFQLVLLCEPEVKR